MGYEITYQVKVNRPDHSNAHYIGIQLPEGATKAEIDSEARRKLETAGWSTDGFTFTVIRTMGEPVEVPWNDQPKFKPNDNYGESGDSGELFTDSCI